MSSSKKPKRTPEEKQAARREVGGRILCGLGIVVGMVLFMVIAYSIVFFLS